MICNIYDELIVYMGPQQVTAGQIIMLSCQQGQYVARLVEGIKRESGGDCENKCKLVGSSGRAGYESKDLWE